MSVPTRPGDTIKRSCAWCGLQFVYRSPKLIHAPIATLEECLVPVEAALRVHEYLCQPPSRGEIGTPAWRCVNSIVESAPERREEAAALHLTSSYNDGHAAAKAEKEDPTPVHREVEEIVEAYRCGLRDGRAGR